MNEVTITHGLPNYAEGGKLLFARINAHILKTRTVLTVLSKCVQNAQVTAGIWRPSPVLLLHVIRRCSAEFCLPTRAFSIAIQVNSPSSACQSNTGTLQVTEAQLVYIVHKQVTYGCCNVAAHGPASNLRLLFCFLQFTFAVLWYCWLPGCSSWTTRGGTVSNNLQILS